eukprot:Selendium_serpulae@DN4443_c0_g1_i2.p1
MGMAEFMHTHLGHLETPEFVKMASKFPSIQNVDGSRSTLKNETDRLAKRPKQKKQNEASTTSHLETKESTKSFRGLNPHSQAELSAKPHSTKDKRPRGPSKPEGMAHLPPQGAHSQSSHMPPHSTKDKRPRGPEKPEAMAMLEVKRESESETARHSQEDEAARQSEEEAAPTPAVTSDGGTADPPHCSETACDNRENLCSGEVGDQASCGSCWAWTTLNAFQSAVCQQFEGLYEAMSVQELIDCEDTCGCSGGHWAAAADYIVEKDRMASAVEYEYESAENSICASEEKSNALVVESETSTAYDLVAPTSLPMVGQDHNEVTDIIALWLRRYGALYVTLAVPGSDEWLYNYGQLVAHCNTGAANHAMTLVGYNFDTNNEFGKRYWIVKNTWGKGWADRGYIYLDVDACPTAPDTETIGVFHEVVLFEANKHKSEKQGFFRK